MSRYGYDYSLAPGHPKGGRSLFRNVLMVGTIVAISVVSGGVVALELLGSGSAVADRQVLATPQAQPVSVRVARPVTPTSAQPAASAPANAGAAVEKPQAVAATAIAALAQPLAQPSTTPAPQAATTPNLASAVQAAAVQEPATVQVPERELTFTTGYARRRAAQAAVTTGSGTKTEVARLEEQNQIGRASKAKPKTTVARQNGPQDQPRVVQQALALGDARDPHANRRPPPQQQGGLFSSNPFGGFFRGLF